MPIHKSALVRTKHDILITFDALVLRTTCARYYAVNRIAVVTPDPSTLLPVLLSHQKFKARWHGNQWNDVIIALDEEV
jgi:hypothetical protein